MVNSITKLDDLLTDIGNTIDNNNFILFTYKGDRIYTHTMFYVTEYDINNNRIILWDKYGCYLDIDINDMLILRTELDNEVEYDFLSNGNIIFTITL